MTVEEEGPRPVNQLVVGKFAAAMIEKLEENNYKGGWSTTTVNYLVGRARQELGEVVRAIDRLRPEPSIVALKAVVWECADVANFMMMLADVCGGLELFQSAIPDPRQPGDGSRQAVPVEPAAPARAEGGEAYADVAADRDRAWKRVRVLEIRLREMVYIADGRRDRALPALGQVTRDCGMARPERSSRCRGRRRGAMSVADAIVRLLWRDGKNKWRERALGEMGVEVSALLGYEVPSSSIRSTVYKRTDLFERAPGESGALYRLTTKARA